MKIDKSLLTGSTGMLILQLLDEKEMYGYEMIDTLEKRSANTFTLSDAYYFRQGKIRHGNIKSLHRYPPEITFYLFYHIIRQFAIRFLNIFNKI